MSLLPPIPNGWSRLRAEAGKPYFQEMQRFVADEYRRHVVYPPGPEIFRALELTSLRNVRVVLLGQDPYHGPGQAHGLAFSVRPGVTPPPSLRNMFRELADDVGVPVPDHGHLDDWARQGVLLLNAVLTVREGEPGSHRGMGWETLTSRLIERVNAKPSRVVFLLLGAQARKTRGAIDATRHAIIEAPHPSPLSAHRGFFGSRIFSRTNAALEEAGRGSIDWRLRGSPDCISHEGTRS